MTFVERVSHHRKAVLFTTALLVAAGVALVMQMPVGLFPDITFPRIVIMIDNGEEPAERVLTEITKPIESVVSSVPGVKTIRSATSRGSAQINIFLDWGSNVVQTMDLLQGQIANMRTSIPASANITLQQMNVSVYPIEGYSLTSTMLSTVDLRDVALNTIRPALLQVAGVAKVEITGGQSREFQVIINPARLAGYHLDIRQVSDAIQKANFVSSTGLVENNYQLYLSLVSGLLTSTDQIAAVTVATVNGVPISVGDVADVKPAVQEQFIRTTAAGREAVLINVMKQPTGSTVQIGADVQAKLAALKLPNGVHVENFYDQSGYINDSIASTRDSILIGIVLAMIVLLIFLRSWRITLVLAIVVPSTIACTFICLNLIGETVNIMTLGGIAAAVGLIIDDSIVVIESIFTHFAIENTGTGKFVFLSAARSAVGELMPAILGSTASTIVIHIPLGFLGGITGAFFKPLSITMVFAMLISFLLSISLAPLLASMFLRTRDIRREVEKEHAPGRIFRSYQSMMRFLLRHSWLAIPIVAGIFFLTYLVYAMVGSSFMPALDEGTFVLDYSSPPGTSLTETNRMLMNVERTVLMKLPEMASYSRRTGTQLGFFLTEPNTGDYLVKLKPTRVRTTDDIISDVRTKVNKMEPRLHIDFGQLLQDVIGDLTNSPSPIEIKLFGSDIRAVQAKADQVMDAITKVQGVVDPFNGIVISGPSMLITVDPRKASFYGLTATDIQDQLETIMSGKVGTSVQLPQKVIGIRVKYPAAYKTDLDSISQVTLTGASGVHVPLQAVANITRTAGQAELNREGLRSYVAVTARIEGRDLGSTIADIKAALAKNVQMPPSIQVEYGGVYETQQESFRNLLTVAVIALLLVFLVLLIEFRDFSVPSSILLVTLCSLLGVMFALWITNMTINISSLVGTIMIIGIVAENAIFIMHYAATHPVIITEHGQDRLHTPDAVLPTEAVEEHTEITGAHVDENTLRRLRMEGVREALIEAGFHRARPIMMTTLAAILALLPLAIAFGAGAQMQQPLAIAVIGGFSISSIMLFVLLPMIYLLFHEPWNWTKIRRIIVKKKIITPESPDAAAA